MITLSIALLLTLQSAQQEATVPVKESASQILSKVFSRYAGAQSISGNIKMSQTARGVTLSINTDLQYDRPSRIYLHQIRYGNNPKEWLLVSDGKSFSYNKPNDRSFGRDRYSELVTQNGVDQKISELYMASEQSLGELNAILDVAICQPSRLNRLKAQWATIKYQGRVTLNGALVKKISGQYRDDPNAPANGEFGIYVTEEGDFVRYETTQRFVFPTISNQPVDVKTTWDSTLKVGEKTNPSLYKVIG